MARIKGVVSGKDFTLRELAELLRRGYSFSYCAATDTLIIEKEVISWVLP